MNSASTSVTVKQSPAESRNKKSQNQPVDLEELVGNSGQQRNWRGIVIALLVIVVVCALITTAIILVTPTKEDENKGEKFTFDDYINGEYKVRQFHAQWMKDGESFLYKNDDGALIEFNCTTNSTEMLMDNTTFRELNTGIWHISEDRMYVLLAHDVRKLYRHSMYAQYSMYSIKDRTRKEFEGPQGPIFRYIGWSPTGHSLVFVQNNNIYYLEDYDYQNPRKQATQITFDGVQDEIFNGIPDWVYEEEVFGSDHALWWSTKGKYILYAQFDDRHVQKFDYPFYGDLTNVYVKQEKIAYPKAGKENPKFKIKVVNLKNTNNNAYVTHEIKPPNHTEFLIDDHYFTSVAWRDDEYFLVSWVNRNQNFSIVTKCVASTGVCTPNMKEEGHGSFVDMSIPPIFTPSGNKYFWILPNQDSNAGYFKHVAMVEFPVSKNGKLSEEEGTKMYLTHGKWEVTEIVGYNAEKQLVYYIATNTGNGVGDPRKRHLFSVSSALNSNFRQTQCLTCNTDCTFARASFSDSGNYYILNCLGPKIPYFVLKSTSSNFEHVLENNEVLRQKLKRKALPTPRYMQFPSADGSEMLYGKLLLPPAYKQKEIITYPLLLEVYGGPGSQKVSDRFTLGWETYLSSAQNVIIGYVDGRGSGYRGNNFLNKMYKSFGTVEVEDTIAAGKYYNNLPYVESSKKAIFGWSYGGFLTASVIGRGTHTFECGISVAPVTDFRYYDSIYTERYMGKPEDNPVGYKRTNVSENAANFKHSRFMLIHGTGDDNVHFQNSAQLMKALVNADVYFRSQVYPDQQHSLNGGNTHRHLYESMDDFLKECFFGQSKKFDLRNKEELQNSKQEPINES